MKSSPGQSPYSQGITDVRSDRTLSAAKSPFSHDSDHVSVKALANAFQASNPSNQPRSLSTKTDSRTNPTSPELQNQYNGLSTGSADSMGRGIPQNGYSRRESSPPQQYTPDPSSIRQLNRSRSNGSRSRYDRNAPKDVVRIDGHVNPTNRPTSSSGALSLTLGQDISVQTQVVGPPRDSSVSTPSAVNPANPFADTVAVERARARATIGGRSWTGEMDNSEQSLQPQNPFETRGEGSTPTRRNDSTLSGTQNRQNNPFERPIAFEARSPHSTTSSTPPTPFMLYPLANSTPTLLSAQMMPLSPPGQLPSAGIPALPPRPRSKSMSPVVHSGIRTNGTVTAIPSPALTTRATFNAPAPPLPPRTPQQIATSARTGAQSEIKTSAYATIRDEEDELMGSQRRGQTMLEIGRSSTESSLISGSPTVLNQQAPPPFSHPKFTQFTSRRPPEMRPAWPPTPKTQPVRACAASSCSGVVATASDKVRLYYALRAAVNGSTSDKRSIDLGLPKERDNRPSCLAFADHPESAGRGRYLWIGTENGDIVVVDALPAARSEPVVDRRARSTTAGMNKIVGLGQIKVDGCEVKGMYGVWDAGNITIFMPEGDREPPKASGRVRSFRGLPYVKHVCASGTDLWCATESGVIEVYRPPPDDGEHSSTNTEKPRSAQGTSALAQFKLDRLKIPAGLTGAIDGIAAAPMVGLVVSGHRSQTLGGVICAWDANSRTALRCVRVCQGWCTAICVPPGTDRIWVAGADKRVYVLRPHAESGMDWDAEKVWEPEGGEVRALISDETDPRHVYSEKEGLIAPPAVAAVCGDGLVRVWDGWCTMDAVDNGLRARENLFASYSTLRVWVGSFNVDAFRPAELGSGSDARFAEGWLRDHLPSDWDGAPPDLVIFGLQEVVDLSNTSVQAKKFFQGTKRGVHEESSSEGGGKYRGWRDKFSDALWAVWPDEGFEAVDGTGLVGLFLCAFVRRAVKGKVWEVSVDSTKTGMAGVHGNKGAIAVRLLFEDTSLAFCNAHLAAHAENTPARLKNVVSIVRDSEFPLPGGRGNGQDTGGIAISFIGGGDGKALMDHENVFFFGDLNFRISPDMAVPGDPYIFSRERCEELIRNENWGALLARDQLDRERRQAPTIESPLRFFDEGELNFAPTFKYDVGSDVYDTSEKRRMPSWCDRILFRGSHIKLRTFARHECRISDHRPVCAAFEIRSKRLDRAAMSTAYETAEKEQQQRRRDHL
ncbi:DNase I-like protein [Gonapodya prolifera JEL478]|uniref:DNase I-like protein n=1 Tax=Gonapodya prolifera (strain JEL478) TaxID=1344416 RepID=A0A139AT56_GONPJ|nr:DNase I-like protein [Gonapodya prolifera JEL478]|eukprot:KXS19864.1 DNase I-like protein [Gonapodya prolifera JEL478]